MQQPASPIEGMKVTYRTAAGGRASGTVAFSEIIGRETFVTVRIEGGHLVKLLARDVRFERPAKKTVRSIGRKLSDIAEGAWSAGHSQTDDTYGAAERRIRRMEKQIQELAVIAILAKDPALTREAVTSSPYAEELLASALVGDWARVAEIAGHIKANTTAPLNTDPSPADPITGATIRLEERNRASLFNFPCCGGLRPAHTSNCREN